MRGRGAIGRGGPTRGAGRAVGDASPRVAPLPASELPAVAKELLARFPPGSPSGLFCTLAHHPALLRKWMEFGNHVLEGSTLPARDRELVILRVAWRCRSTYVFAAHVPIARRAGVSDADREHVLDLSDEGAAESDALLLRATDELCGEAALSDAVWSLLERRYALQQILDLIFTVGQYQLVSTVTGALRIPSEAASGPPAADRCRRPE